MTGYFSKIARQSGVRLGNQQGLHSRPVSAAPPLPPRIDRDEVVMVGPEPAPENVSKVSRVEAKAIPESQKSPAAEAKPLSADTREPSPRESSSETQQPMVATPSAPAARDPEIVRPAVTDSPPRASKPNDPPEVSDTTAMVPPASETPRETDSTEQHVDHFAETIKIISGREVSKEDASAIVVREIHEWIAAGPQGPDKRVEEVLERDHVVVKPEHLEVEEREPGVVRISGEVVTRREVESKPDDSPRQTETVALHEQTLDLSIGSINVVIEGDPVPPPQPQQPATPRQSSANQTSRAPSRLRRNYI